MHFCITRSQNCIYILFVCRVLVSRRELSDSEIQWVMIKTKVKNRNIYCAKNSVVWSLCKTMRSQCSCCLCTSYTQGPFTVPHAEADPEFPRQVHQGGGKNLLLPRANGIWGQGHVLTGVFSVHKGSLSGRLPWTDTPWTETPPGQRHSLDSWTETSPDRDTPTVTPIR